MKKVLLSAGALVIAISAGAQIYWSEDFAGPSFAVTTFDNDGDGNVWGVTDVTGNMNTTNNSAYSNSWSSGTGPLTPDNFLITDAINLTSISGLASFTWRAGSPETAGGYWQEYYDVIITTSNNNATIASTSPIFGETLPSGGTMHDRSVDISAYVGQSIYITFRHHNCTDKNYLVIDDLAVKKTNAVDAEITDLSYDKFTAAGSMNIAGTVRNNGTSSINSFKITYDAGSGPVSQTFSQTITAGGSYSFTHGTPLALSAGNAYPINVCVDLTGDLYSANDCMTKSVGFLSSIPTKYTIGEEKTGTWCGFCPRGAVKLSEMESTPTFIGVAVHNGDPMVVSSYDNAIGSFVPGGYPGAGVDRVEDGDPNTFAAMHAARANVLTPANITVAAAQNSTGSSVQVTVTANWVTTLSGTSNYRLGAIVTEDDVMGSGGTWNQINYYASGSYGALTDPNTGFNWVTAGDPVSPSSFGGYDHVARALGNNQILGDAGSVPASITDGAQTSKTYTFSSSAWNLAKCHFVGFLCDANTGEIINAGKSQIGGYVGFEENNTVVADLSVYPNPASDLTNIRIEIAENANVQLDIINTLGQVVYTETTNDLSAGAYLYQVDVADFAAGLYTVRAAVNGEVQTSKLSVR